MPALNSHNVGVKNTNVTTAKKLRANRFPARAHDWIHP